MSNYWWSNSPPDVPHPNAAPVGRKPATAAAPPPPYPGYLTPQQQLEMAQAQAKALIQPYLDILNAQQTRQTQAHMAQQAGLAKLYDVLGGSLQGVGSQIGDIYAQGASGLGSGFDTGYTHGWEIAKQGLQGEGRGFQHSAEALPAIAGQQGGVKLLTAVQQANEQDQQLADLIKAQAASLPEKAQSFLASIQQDQAQLSSRAQTYAQKQQALALTSGQKDRANAWGVADRFTKNSSHFYVAVQQPDGSWGVQDAGPKSGQKKASLKVVKTADGWWAIDPYSGKKVRKVGNAGAPKPIIKTAADGTSVIVDPVTQTQTPLGGYNPAKPVKPTKPQVVTLANGTKGIVHPDGTITPAGGTNPAKPPKPPKAKFTASQRKAAWQTINQSKSPQWYSPTDPSKPLPVSQIRGILAAFNKQHIANGDSRYVTVNGKRVKVSFKQKPMTLVELATRTPAELADIGLVKTKTSAEDVYKQLVETIGIPPRLAWTWVRKVYPNFGPDYFSGHRQQPWRGAVPSGGGAF